MPTCQSCHTKWTWKQSIRKSFTLDTSMSCPFCGEKQYLTKQSRLRSSFCSVVPPFTLLLPAFFNISPLMVFSILIVIFVVVVSLLPFFIELSNEEEPLF